MGYLLPRHSSASKRGVTFIDAIVGAALLLIVFTSVFGVLRTSLRTIIVNKAKVGGVALAHDQIEYIRSLSYDEVGTVGGIPSGPLEQLETEVLNGITYTKRTVIQYADAPEDGEGDDDENGITTDYKIAKVEVSWTLHNETRSTSAVTTITPPGIETTTGGGTLRVTVLDALGVPLQGAEVLVVNNTTNPSVNLATFSNANGQTTLGGAPAASEYEVSVTKTGYSTASTYAATAGNPNPVPAHLSVLASQLTSVTFQIDRLSELLVRTFRPVELANVIVNAGDSGAIESFLNTIISGGTLRLSTDPVTGEFLSSGNATTPLQSDPLLSSWVRFAWEDSVPAGTNLKVKMYADDGAGGHVIIPDSDLPGNSAGFTTSPLDLSGLSAASYPSLSARFEFSTSDPLFSPSIEMWAFHYERGPIPEPNIDFELRGAKTIGTDGGGLPVYKYVASHATNASGVWSDDALEWDNYTVTPQAAAAGFDVSEICKPNPMALAPDVSETVDIMLVPDTPHTLRVIVRGGSDELVSDAQVRLSRNSFEETQDTSECGQTFFESLSQGTQGGGNPYSLEVSKAGYTTYTNNSVDVTGDSIIEVVLQNS